MLLYDDDLGHRHQTMGSNRLRLWQTMYVSSKLCITPNRVSNIRDKLVKFDLDLGNACAAMVVN